MALPRLPSRARLAAWCRAHPRVVALFAVLAAVNAGAWIWALVAFRQYPIALGTALLAYGLGLRHAIDADHIAAIDNVTRKLMHDGARPHAVGFFFSLGHSTVVVLASVAIAAAAGGVSGPLAWIRDLGGSVGTIVSAAFLAIIAIINLFVLISVRRTLGAVRRGEPVPQHPEAGNAPFAGGGLLARVLRPLFRVISRSWHMYPLGLLFGLGFDTASEIGLLGISAAEASRGMPIWSIMIFPVLFTAGMSLLDTADSVVMVGAYGWAFTDPIRKLYYNIAITLTSVLVALLVGGIEVLGLVGRRVDANGGFWSGIASLNANAGRVGLAVVLVLAAAWAAGALVSRRRGAARLNLAGD
jgi:high-affinity nickel-transport protein